MGYAESMIKPMFAQSVRDMEFLDKSVQEKRFDLSDQQSSISPLTKGDASCA